MGGVGGDLPAERGEFAGDRDDGHAVGFAPCVFELAPAGVQASLRAPGNVDDLGGLAALATLQRFPDRGVAAVVVGGLDQKPAGVGGAGFGDRSLTALLAGGALGRDDPEVAGQLVGMVKTLKLADLSAQSER